ncbi:sodium channel subunit beta-4 isoform X2 [Rhinatrema bivittatum]|uniref:sodium channel subunit beta-4 isoform X2 n=1 Tax=Rhinatrema bivittatum TaxID=194408 RepID=UPI001129E0BC|nr:sodium channel subunit beta-4 isoform X2 [Rhinatrema bivittatum]
MAQRPLLPLPSIRIRERRRRREESEREPERRLLPRNFGLPPLPRAFSRLRSCRRSCRCPPGEGMAVSAGDRALSAFRRGTRRLLVLCMVLSVPPGAVSLEVSFGKNNPVTALNGSDVLLPCFFFSCIGFENVHFAWFFNKTELLYEGTIKNKQSLPQMKKKKDDQFELASSNAAKEYNISLLLRNVDFEDEGEYSCNVTNPSEMNAKQGAVVKLIVVDKFVKPDNTLMLIILAAVGGFIGFLILVFILKKVICFALKKNQEKKNTS